MTAPSDTPRTDAAVVSREFIAREMDSYAFKFVLADFARTLERKLSAVKIRREEWERLNPTGGAAAMLEAMAERVRAGEPFHEVLEDFNMAPLEKAVEGQENAAQDGLAEELTEAAEGLRDGGGPACMNDPITADLLDRAAAALRALTTATEEKKHD